jgi:ABC-type uncharacterized transport system substrate-binding protein
MQFCQLKRREFITLLGGAAMWPVVARAQQQGMTVIGYLSPGSADSFAVNLAIFRRTLTDAHLPALAAELVGRKVTVIYAVANAAAYAAKAATSTIPIVFLSGGDPVEVGLVSSLNRPEGNATGVTLFLNELAAKRLQLLREIVPNVAVIAFMVNPTNPRARLNTSELQAAACIAGQDIVILNVSHESEFDETFTTLIQKGAGALLVDGDILFNDQRAQLVKLAARHKVPASYQVRDSATAGGLMSYGPNVSDGHRQASLYLTRILKGEKPAELPVLRPTKFDLVINLRTAKALGLQVPDTLLASADEVIE